MLQPSCNYEKQIAVILAKSEAVEGIDKQPSENETKVLQQMSMEEVK